jgi:co-chaperonin GroES (HSP10)
MFLGIDKEDLDKFILIGDRVLIKPKTPESKTKSGLLLPPTVQQKEKIHSGYIIKTGPGYPIPAIADIEEPWHSKDEQVRYVPLQPQAGDLAIYLQNSGYEIEYKDEKYIIVSQSAILMLIRDPGLFDE